MLLWTILSSCIILERVLYLLTQIHLRNGRRSIELGSPSEHHLIQVNCHVIRRENTTGTYPMISFIKFLFCSRRHIVRNYPRHLHLLFFLCLWGFLICVNQFYLSEWSSMAHVWTGKRAILVILRVQGLRCEVREWKPIQFDSVAVLRTQRPLLFFLGLEVIVLQRTTPEG